MDGVLPLADKFGVEIPAGSRVEEAYLEWALDEDRILLGRVWAHHDGKVSIWGTSHGELIVASG
ncbi:hypothetical protein [Streptomyces sp. NPDC047453]|uniref:hypothetical protein n=1 Tax=Streptomyces sp. NPDC047453 TaxID=3154812 RepID=UPI0033CF76A9